MAKIILVALVVFAVCQVSWAAAKPAKSKAEKVADKSVVEDLANQAQVLVNNVTTTLGLKDLPTSDDVFNTLNNSTKVLAAHAQNLLAKLQTEVKAHSGEVDNIIKQAQTKLNETATNLEAAVGPDATHKAKELQQSLNTGLQNIFAEMEKLVNALQPQVKGVQDDLTKFTKSSLDQFVKVTKDIETNVKNSISEHEKTHKA